MTDIMALWAEIETVTGGEVTLRHHAESDWMASVSRGNNYVLGKTPMEAMTSLRDMFPATAEEFDTASRERFRQWMEDFAVYRETLPVADPSADFDIDDMRETVEDLVRQFAYPTVKDGVTSLTTGGLSALEGAFSVLGWDDPYPCPENACEWPGCTAWATCGSPTPDGYKMHCSDHYREVLG